MTETPKLEGVSIAHKKDGSIYFRSSVTYRRKHISLGSFPNAEAAHLAYSEAGRLLNSATLSLEDYNDSYTISFEKWVILINFRDNGIYFSTPIYVRPKFFLYYLSRDVVLKFDTDDLFYYSSHKIMQRKGHLFVADYGMQVNILNRYGIKNYAVRGRDYEFVNGDIHDFRYENIEVHNPYNGVRMIPSENGIRYKAYIHINGNYIIGTYKSAADAAIAYNKAIDILKKKGLHKNFTPNYMDGMSPYLYATTYSQLKISDKILNLNFE